MKKVWKTVIITAVMLVLSLSSCGLLGELRDELERINETTSSPVPTGEAQSSEQRTYTAGNVTFTVWEDMSPLKGYDNSFVTRDKKSVYQLQGVSPLGKYTPQEFYDELKKQYAEKHEIVKADEKLSPCIVGDRTQCEAARIDMVDDNAQYFIDVIIAPSKNMVVTFAAQCARDYEYPIKDVRTVSRTLVFNVGDKDYVSGDKTIIVDNSSELCLSADNSFVWYQIKDDHSSARVDGTYEVYYGQAAVDKVASMTQYGLTKQELDGVITANMSGYMLGGGVLASSIGSTLSEENVYQVCRDTFYAVILHNANMTDGDSMTAVNRDTLYVGYYIPEIAVVDMLNANTANYSKWEIK